MKYVVIDYHKRYSVVCIIDDTGNIVAEFGTSTPMPIRNATREFGAELEKAESK